MNGQALETAHQPVIASATSELASLIAKDGANVVTLPSTALCVSRPHPEICALVAEAVTEQFRGSANQRFYDWEVIYWPSLNCFVAVRRSHAQALSLEARRTYSK